MRVNDNQRLQIGVGIMYFSKFVFWMTSLVGLALINSQSLQAATVFTKGAGSAVSSVDLMADFESNLALTENPYFEGGMAFSRSNLSFNNNGCGFAGCSSHPGIAAGPTPFTGNYMYGTGVQGKFTIRTSSAELFYGLEMILGTGNVVGGDPYTIAWSTLLEGSLVSSGSENIGLMLPAIYGWHDADGFDEFVFRVFREASNAPAFDTVRAQTTKSVTPIPLPTTLSVLLAGIGILGLSAWRRQRSSAKINR
ncbi:PEP-CTERM sorting domain-containing protein [uncultured Roseibium sp.]|uniref:PEP-CTERM sorting domain-containing protein n=1 Tax=uncultured Roseibium sp. TaxID=1936171 RepID=UPI00260C0334|nr:PEP-CTERM sorting domain-containing protein [uncultured Roseibium sp.]